MREGFRRAGSTKTRGPVERRCRRRRHCRASLRLRVGLRPQGANKWSGQIYNPEDGKTYDATVVLESPNVLKVQGCVLFICETRTWTRKG